MSTQSTTQLLLNSSNWNSSKNAFEYTFANDQVLDHHVIGLQNLVMYNQFYNISSALQNNQVKIDFPSGASSYVSTTYTIPDGYYDSPETFSLWLQAQMLASKYCYFPSSSQTTYYLEMKSSTTQYSFVLQTYAVPTSVVPPTGATWSQLTGSTRSPRIYFGKNLGKVWGFSESSTDFTTSYGASTTGAVILSNITPQIRDSTTIIITCNAVYNSSSSPTTYFNSMRISGSFGSAIKSNNQMIIYQQVQKATYRTISFQMFDQNMKALSIIDPNIMMLVVLKSV